MKTDIEIITGFIGSGKTSFINFLVDSTLLKNEKLTIICCEKGMTSLSTYILENPKIKVEYCSKIDSLNRVIQKSLILYNPHRIIIEFNGTHSLNDLLDILLKTSLKNSCSISTIYYLADATTFNLYFDNMLNIFSSSIKFSNLIILNNTKKISLTELKTIKSKLIPLNPYGILAEIDDFTLMKETIKNMNILDNGIQKKLRIFLKDLIYKLSRCVGE